MLDNAFHVSIAWSFAVPDPALRRLTEEAFNNYDDDDDDDKKGSSLLPPFPDRGDSDGSGGERKGKEQHGKQKPPLFTTTTTTTIGEEVRTMRVHVDGVKVKVGNVITHVPLPDRKSRRAGDGGEKAHGIFGI